MPAVLRRALQAPAKRLDAFGEPTRQAAVADAGTCGPAGGDQDVDMLDDLVHGHGAERGGLEITSASQGVTEVSVGAGVCGGVQGGRPGGGAFFLRSFRSPVTCWA